jgi:hypothetical protein
VLPKREGPAEVAATARGTNRRIMFFFTFYPPPSPSCFFISNLSPEYRGSFSGEIERAKTVNNSKENETPKQNETKRRKDTRK